MTRLIAKAKNGNKKAMEKIYESTCDELFCYCLQLCGNEHDAQDLMQDTYLTVFEKLEQYRRDDNFKGWIHTIALHKYYNRLRAEKPQLRTEEPDESVETVSELYAPESYAEKKELQKLLNDIIAECLSDTQRLTVTLYYYDEMSIGEIAKELDCPEGTVKTRLYHSRKILKDELLKRGITLGGSAILVSAVLKAYGASFTASAAATAAAGTVIAERAASTAAKSVFAYAKGKIIAGAAAVAVAGGVAGIYQIANNNDEDKTPSLPEHSVSTERPAFATAIPVPVTTAPKTETTEPETEASTGISQPGGAPVEYSFDGNLMKIMIPENYTPSSFFKTSNSDGGFSLTSIPIPDSDLENRRFWGMHVKEVLKFRPDTFSGDEVLFMVRLEEPEEIDMYSELSSMYGNVTLSDAVQLAIPVDNTNSPESPIERTANRYSFTAEGSNGEINGTAIIFDGNLKNTHIFIFSDCSGIRQQEYESIISSISLSYTDNSWRDQYNIPESMR